MIVSMKVFCGATCPLLIGIAAVVLRSGGMTIRRLLLKRRYIGILACTGCWQSKDSRKSCAITTATTTSTKRFHVCAAAEALVPIGALRPSGAQGPASFALSLARRLYDRRLHRPSVVLCLASRRCPTRRRRRRRCIP